MNSKEALKDLREVKGWNDDEFNKRLDIIEKDLQRNEAMTPHVIKFVQFEPSVGICVCGQQVCSAQNYCDCCGQKLDWEVWE